MVVDLHIIRRAIVTGLELEVLKSQFQADVVGARRDLPEKYGGIVRVKVRVVGAEQLTTISRQVRAAG